MKTDPKRYVTLPGEDAFEMVAEASQHLSDEWRIKTAEQFRRAILEDCQFAINPILDMTESYARFLREFLAKTVREGRMIDFGFVPNEVLKQSSTTSRTLFEAGELGNPFDVWLGVMPWEGGFTAYHVMHKDGAFNIVEYYGIHKPGAAKPLILVWDLISIRAETGTTMTGAWPVQESFLPISGTYEEEQKRGANSLDPLVTMLKLLSDTSVPVEYVPAPDRLNRHREKQGRVPIPAHHVVHTRDYISALRHGASVKGAAKGGTHASPIAHWRRAHQRHLASGRIVKVKASQVNWRDADELHRLFYRL